MNGPDPGPDVLRGMRVEAVPLRLARFRSAIAPPPLAPALPAVTPQQEGFQQGFEQGLREGQAQGLRSGQEEGLRQGRTEAAGQVQAAVDQAVREAVQSLHAEQSAVRAVACALGDAFDAALEAAQDEMVALCHDTICRILGATAMQPDAVRSQVAHLLASCSAADAIVLHVHPQDAALLEPWDAEGASPPAVRWRADPEVMLGGCILRSAAGALDARLETALDACKAALLAGRARWQQDDARKEKAA